MFKIVFKSIVNTIRGIRYIFKSLWWAMKLPFVSVGKLVRVQSLWLLKNLKEEVPEETLTAHLKTVCDINSLIITLVGMFYLFSIPILIYFGMYLSLALSSLIALESMMVIDLGVIGTNSTWGTQLQWMYGFANSYSPSIDDSQMRHTLNRISQNVQSTREFTERSYWDRPMGRK